MNTPVTSGGAALENYKPWQPAEDWTLLEGCDVEVHGCKGLLDQGRVGSVTADGNILWLLQDGASTRRIIQKTPETYVRLARAGYRSPSAGIEWTLRDQPRYAVYSDIDAVILPYATPTQAAECRRGHQDQE